MLNVIKLFQKQKVKVILMPFLNLMQNTVKL